MRNFDYTTSPNVSLATLRAGLIRQQTEMDAITKTQYAMCGQAMGKRAWDMGTTHVVRDIDRIMSVLEGEGALMCVTLRPMELVCAGS
jgi:hypothetical protein